MRREQRGGSEGGTGSSRSYGDGGTGGADLRVRRHTTYSDRECELDYEKNVGSNILKKERVAVKAGGREGRIRDGRVRRGGRCGSGCAEAGQQGKGPMRGHQSHEELGRPGVAKWHVGWAEGDGIQHGPREDRAVGDMMRSKQGALKEG